MVSGLSGGRARGDQLVASRALAVQGGARALALGLEAELQTRWGLVLAAGPLFRPYPSLSLGARIAYNHPLSEHWALRPGLRAEQTWDTRRPCLHSCQSSIFLAELGLHYRSQSGFVFEYGLPVVAWVDSAVVGDGQEKRAYLPPVSLVLGSLLLGYAGTF